MSANADKITIVLTNLYQQISNIGLNVAVFCFHSDTNVGVLATSKYQNNTHSQVSTSLFTLHI